MSKMTQTKISDIFIQTIVSGDFQLPDKKYEWIGNYNVINALIRTDDNSCVYENCKYKLSKNGRTTIYRNGDFIHEFKCSVYPNSSIVKATLFIGIQTKKDKNNVDKEWIYKKDMIKWEYIPIKTLHNPNSSFTFFDNPIPIYLYKFNPISIEIIYSDNCVCNSHNIFVNYYHVHLSKRDKYIDTYDEKYKKYIDQCNQQMI